MASLENLPADQRAVLQLVLQRGRSYNDIARLLSIDPAAVRQRAAAALGALGPQTGLDSGRQGVITDYLLGQLDPAGSEAARASIGGSPGERAWARVVAAELAPLASQGLPEIPTAAEAPTPTPPPPAAPAPLPPSPPPVAAPIAPPVAPAPPAAAPPAPEAASAPAEKPKRQRKQREPLFLGRKRAKGDQPTGEAKPPKEPKPAKPAKAPKERKQREPLFLGRNRATSATPKATAAAPQPKVPVGDDDERRSSLLGGALLIILTVVIVAAIVVILVSSGGSSDSSASHRATTTASQSSAPAAPGAPAASGTTTSSGSSSAKVVAQVNLTPPNAKSKAAGIAEVLKEGTSDGIAIVAQNVPPNTKKPPNAYAVWLYNSASDAHILGFVNPGVGSNGRLSTAGGLPSNAAHYKQLIVTVETKAAPKTPGQIILQGALNGL